MLHLHISCIYVRYSNCYCILDSAIDDINYDVSEKVHSVRQVERSVVENL